MCNGKVSFQLRNIKKHGFILVEVVIGTGIGLMMILFLHTLLMKSSQLNAQSKCKIEAHYLVQQIIERVKADPRRYDVGTYEIPIKEDWTMVITILEGSSTPVASYPIAVTLYIEGNPYLSFVSIIAKEKI